MAKESSAWAAARDNLAPFGVLERVENGVGLGFPDTVYTLVGVSGLVEMKATVTSLTLEQVLFAERWSRAGGLCHTLLHADRVWFLYDAAGTRRLFERAEEPGPLVRAEGAFPLREMLRYLAPVDRRLRTRSYERD